MVSKSSSDGLSAPNLPDKSNVEFVTSAESLAGFDNVDVLVADIRANGIHAGLSKAGLVDRARGQLPLSGIETSEDAACYLFLSVSTIANPDSLVYGYAYS